ncbi:6-phosphofructokinase [Botrimarina mediterranea]|uniref:ATP-dependent 6-phosphofructokinase n=1 Tax=Botrimarina mediterranea TaxID=2528022 RepID=A0A518K451_9BACT|nr:ATP-dependent 6-phosphofructokinase [Botrimarina mediterranea]QDV72573.1 6-phosphofructokinase 1 [Botrimarina mediterranea]QDV77145.1 6-phosphofructokinase 1 [Planctomycetes bacterium K2D]
MSKQRIGILTSGGDCPGLNAVIRGAVKASHQLGYDCVGFLKGYEGLYDPVQYVHLTPSSTRGILSQGGTILGSTNKGRFAATVGVQDRQEIEPYLIEGVKNTIEQLGITGLVCVGGDGSLAVAQQFHEQGIPVVGVPKTIDNDLSATAFTFGFDSAVECATDALDRLHTTAASHERIMVLEVMGRHAGWIALHAGIAGGGDVILLPEIEWNWDHVCHKILQRESQGKKFTLVVVAEGAHLPGGDLVGEQRSGAQMKLGGIGRTVCDEIEHRLQREVRLSVLGHLQRGGQPTTFDRVLATQYGAHAVRLVHQKKFGEMLCYQPPEMTSVPIMEAVNVLRRVDVNGAAVQAARALGISFGDRPVNEVGFELFDTIESETTAPAHAEQIEEYTDEFTEQLETPAVEVASEPTPVMEEAVASVEEPAVVEETLAVEEAAEVEETEPAIEVPASEEPVIEKTVAASVTSLATEAIEEEEAAEEIADSLLDLVADADEMIHGAVEIDAATINAAETESVEAEDVDTEMPETDGLEADSLESEEPGLEQAADDAEEVGVTAPKSLEEGLEVDSPALSLDETEATSTAEETAGPEAAEKLAVDLEAVQAELAEKIADAAKAKRDAAQVETIAEPDAESLSVADLVKQKLASMSPTAKAAAEKPEPTKSVLDEPHGEDLVADARAALEEALAK